MLPGPRPTLEFLWNSLPTCVRRLDLSLDTFYWKLQMCFSIRIVGSIALLMKLSANRPKCCYTIDGWLVG